ncbi:hypothetical protein ACPCIR_02965 [Mycobacterium sp. NPDC051198]
MTVENTQPTAPATPTPTSATPPEPPASDAEGGDPGTEGTEPPADEQDDGGGRRNREAAYRRRAQAAEAERDTLRSQLDALHRQMVGGIAKAHGLPEVELLESAGHELSSFVTDDGEVSAAKVIEATTATMARYSIKPQPHPPLPNRQQGSYGMPAQAGVKAAVNKALGRD